MHTEGNSRVQERKRLRAGMDVRVWRMSGLGTFVRELLAAMARLELPIDWTFVGPKTVREEMTAGVNVEHWVEFDKPIYAAGSTFFYPRLPALDVFHYPHYNLPLIGSKRVLATVFDLFHLHYGSQAKRQYQSLFLQRLRWSRAAIMTASEKTARELASEAGIAPRRIRCIPLGPGRGSANPAASLPAAIKLMTGQPVRPPWLLAVGIDQPHKNFDFLLSALGLYYQRRPNAPPLVWTGLSPEAMQRRAKTLPASLREHVALDPYTTADRLDELFAGAAALVFPSLDEGFGLPPLEAMARGVPVLCSRREPMDAILGSAALYFEPTESASLWRIIDRLLDAPGIRQDSIRRGLQQAAHYSWEKCAREVYEMYRGIAGVEG